MSKFKKKKSGGLPPLSTASLPDIVFMLLFFFMVSTVMRETTLLVKFSMPDNVTEVQKLERKNLVSYIYVGAPVAAYTSTRGTEPVMQLNDSFEPVEKIKDFVYAEKESRRPEERDALTFSIKGDKDAKMNLIVDIKQELRKAQALKLNYSAKKGKPTIEE